MIAATERWSASGHQDPGARSLLAGDHAPAAPPLPLDQRCRDGRAARHRRAPAADHPHRPAHPAARRGPRGAVSPLHVRRHVRRARPGDRRHAGHVRPGAAAGRAGPAGTWLRGPAGAPRERRGRAVRRSIRSRGRTGRRSAATWACSGDVRATSWAHRTAAERDALLRQPEADQVAQRVDAGALGGADPGDVVGVEHAARRHVPLAGADGGRLDLVVLGRDHVVRQLVGAQPVEHLDVQLGRARPRRRRAR